MKTIRLLTLTLLVAFTAALHARPLEGKTQQLTSPDQVPEGLAKSDWQSIRAAYEAGRHAFQPVEGGWQARNPGQQWTTTFDGRGFVAEPRDGGWQWGLELKSYGFGENHHAIGGTPVVKAEGQRLNYQWDAAVQEWWVNDARGLEHGYTIAERPSEPFILHPSSFILHPSAFSFPPAARCTRASPPMRRACFSRTPPAPRSSTTPASRSGMPMAKCSPRASRRRGRMASACSWRSAARATR